MLFRGSGHCEGVQGRTPSTVVLDPAEERNHERRPEGRLDSVFPEM